MNARTLLAATTAAVALTGAATAQAATMYPYKISIRGEQTHEWAYTGNAADSCGIPEDGKGEEHFTFRSPKAYKTIVARAGGNGRWGTQASWKLKAEGTRTGSFTRHLSQANSDLCRDEDYKAPETDCGPATWTIDAFMDYGLSKPYGRLQVTSAAGFLPGGAGTPFDECPWFEGPSDSNYWDQLGTTTGTHSNDMSAGLRYAWQDVKQQSFSRGKSFDVTRHLTRPYDYKDQWGTLHGNVDIRWTIHFQRVKR